jgi:nicotinamide-nucleotide amidase
MTEKIIPYLTQRYTLGIIKAHTLKTAGIGESALDEMLGSDLLGSSNPSIGLAAHSGQIDVRITAKASTADDAQSMIDVMTQQVLDRAGRFIFGTNDDRLENVLVDYMDSHNDRLALAEIGIGTEISSLLRTHPKGASVITESIVAANIDELKLEGSASLQERVRAYANALRTDTGAAASIVVMSNPDVDEAADDAEGTVVVVSTESSTRSRVYGFGALSETARGWVTSWSLANLWRMLRDHANED